MIYYAWKYFRDFWLGQEQRSQVLWEREMSTLVESKFLLDRSTKRLLKLIIYLGQPSLCQIWWLLQRD